MEDVDPPDPGADDLLVDIRAVGVNHYDLIRQRGADVAELPRITGLDFSGIVEEVGSNVTGFVPGDRVYGDGAGVDGIQGSLAERLAIPANRVAHLPERWNFEQGAIGHVAVAAWKALITCGDLTVADTVLVHGGAGGLGHLAIQIATAGGAHVITTVGSAEEREFVESMGADTVLDYTRDDLAAAITGATPFNPDIIIDHRPQDYLELDVDVAGDHGRVVYLAGPGGTYDNAPLGRSKNVTMYHLGSKDPAKIGSWLARLARLADAEDIDIEIHRSYPMAEAAQAQQEMLETDIGRIVVTV